MIEPLDVLQGKSRCCRRERSGAAWASDVVVRREAMGDMRRETMGDMVDDGGANSCVFVLQRMVQ